MTVHWLRPLWLLAFLPWVLLCWRVWRYQARLQGWQAVCDQVLLRHLVKDRLQQQSRKPWFGLLTAMALLIVALAGPAWQQLPVPAYQPVEPRVLVLDLSDSMLAADLSPDRLTRAKFKLQDLFKRKDAGQFGLVVFTGEPFVVSPLTSDGETINALLPNLTPDIMPIGGHDLAYALKEAAKLIEQAGFHHGQILVLTAEQPLPAAIQTASSLASQSISTSILPMRQDERLPPGFAALAQAGNGQLLGLTANDADLRQWLEGKALSADYALSQYNDVPLWRDEGRWFLIPALLLLIPVFRRGWLQRVGL